ncbi:MAG: DNA primase [Rickettsiales bacterium]|nr:DNA primase [Rickettsiales bacterium]
MFFEKDFPDKLRSQILTSEVVGKKVKLKSRGGEFQGLCPFHNEKTPSFTVNDQKGFFHCFGCQEHGDIVSFVMKTQGLEFKEAVEQIAADFGIEVPYVEKIDVKKIETLNKDYSLLEDACTFFEENLHKQNGFVAREYFKKRTINSVIAKKFRLGFALNSYEELTNHLKKLGYSNKEMLESGIIGENKQKNLFDKLRNRVIFPILDKKNRVIAFGGRTVGDDMPKYLNSAETNVFKKNKTLYNISFARKAIFNEKCAIIVEGYMDVIALAKNGIENVVAGLGTALSKEHLLELFYITDKIIICLDGDLAGIKAAKRILEIALPLISARKNIEFNILPNGMDPDDFIKEFGVEVTRNSFLETIPMSKMMFDFALEEVNGTNTKITAEKKAKLETNLEKKLELISDTSSRKHFGYYFKDLLFHLGKGNKKSSVVASKIKYKKPENNKSDIIAQGIIAFIIKFPFLAKYKDNQFDICDLHFVNEDLLSIKEEIDLELENHDVDEKNHDNYPKISKILLTTLEKLENNNHVSKIRGFLTSLGSVNIESVPIKFRILLLQNLLLEVEEQYKDSLVKIEEITTDKSGISNQKITEIFKYKNDLEQEILSLEKELS